VICLVRNCIGELLIEEFSLGFVGRCVDVPDGDCYICVSLRFFV